MKNKQKKTIMKTINELQDEVIEEFSNFDDWMEKYQLLIDLGNEQEPLAPQYKTEQNLIDGCQSRVWLQSDLTDDGKIIFQAESDALIVKGIITLLIKVVSGHTPDEILDSELYFIEKIGLKVERIKNCSVGNTHFFCAPCNHCSLVTVFNCFIGVTDCLT